MRTTAKWIIAAAAAVGATLLGGAPLAAIGSIHGVTSAAVAFSGLIIALAGVGWAIWHTSEALIPPATTLAALDKPQLAKLRAQIAADSPSFYGPFGTSVQDLQAACRLYDTSAAHIAIMLAAERDPSRQRILTQGLADASANAAQARARLRWLLGLVHTWRVRDLLRHARLHAFVGAAAAALGAVLFISATTPSSATTTGSKSVQIAPTSVPTATSTKLSERFCNKQAGQPCLGYAANRS